MAIHWRQSQHCSEQIENPGLTRLCRLGFTSLATRIGGSNDRFVFPSGTEVWSWQYPWVTGMIMDSRGLLLTDCLWLPDIQCIIQMLPTEKRCFQYWLGSFCGPFWGLDMHLSFQPWIWGMVGRSLPCPTDDFLAAEFGSASKLAKINMTTDDILKAKSKYIKYQFWTF